MFQMRLYAGKKILTLMCITILPGQGYLYCMFVLSSETLNLKSTTKWYRKHTLKQKIIAK